jgi:hypothetical protein
VLPKQPYCPRSGTQPYRSRPRIERAIVKRQNAGRASENVKDRLAQFLNRAEILDGPNLYSETVIGAKSDQL